MIRKWTGRIEGLQNFIMLGLQDAFENILDTMTCGDGGIKFMNFCTMLRALDDAAVAGDGSAREILLTIKRFSKLIDLAGKK